MRSPLIWTVVIALFVASLGCAQEKKDPYAGHIAPTAPRSPADEKKAFELPPGFEAQLVAAEPDIHKPLNLAFDAHGRLWVSETVEYPFPAAPGTPGRDAVKVLEDFGPDGRARKIHTFAAGLNIPIGVLPLPGARPQEALVYSIPNIYRLTDTTGTGRADQRQALYGRFGVQDTHGMTNNFTWGFDGWVYACHGFSNTSNVRGKTGPTLAMQSGNTYRMRPDGSRVEWFTHGQVNPFGLSIDPLGNLYSCDCHTEPIYQLLRGAYYPSFGKPDDGLGFGPEMFSNYRDSTAIAGIAYYAADNFPTPYRGSAFVGDVVTNRLVQFAIDWHGSTPRASLRYFLKSADPWFRPVSIQLGPDGALYVADFYNRIIGHYEVPLTHPGRDRERGRIWRIVYRGPAGRGTPAPRTDWTTASIDDLVHDLGHPNLTVRIKAANQLVERGGKAGVEAVRRALAAAGQDQPSAWRRMHGLWVLERCGALDEATLKKSAQDHDRGVRVHAQRVLSERTGSLPESQRSLVLAGLKDPDANVQRAAADALGQHPAAENVRPLLDLRHAVPAYDTHLLHVVRMALRDQLRPASTWDRLAGEQLSDPDRRAIADVALGVPSAESAAYLLDYLKRFDESGDMLSRSAHHIARYGKPDVTRGLLAFARSRRPGELGRQVLLLHAIQKGTQERGAQLDDAVRAWATELTGKLLASGQPAHVQAGLELIGSLRLEGEKDRLAALAGNHSAPEGERAAALTALAALDVRRHAPVLGRVLADAAAPVTLREQAANLLARANQPETRAELLRALPTVPARLQNAIATGLAATREGGEKLLAAVTEGKASARLLQDQAVALRLAADHIPGLKGRLDRLTEGLPPADERLQELLRRRHEGFLASRADPARGAQVFEKNCAICHMLAGKGARIGPQLDGIGVRGLDRLLEDVLDPNRNVDQAFRLTTLELKKGQQVSGLLLREEGEVLVLADAQGKEVRVPRGEVEERSVSQMSPMPANFADQIPEPDFYHLLAYLLRQQAPRTEKPGGR